MVEVPGFSKEFCGGTHVHHTGDIGLFLLTSEQGVSAGTRRVEALAGEAAVERAQDDQGILEELEQSAKVDRRELVDEYAASSGSAEGPGAGAPGPQGEAGLGGGAFRLGSEDQAELGDTLVWTPRFEGLDRKAHAAVVDEFRNKHRERPFVVLSSSVNDGERPRDRRGLVVARRPPQGRGGHEAPRPEGRRAPGLRPGRRGRRRRGRRAAAAVRSRPCARCWRETRA